MSKHCNKLKAIHLFSLNGARTGKKSLCVAHVAYISLQLWPSFGNHSRCSSYVKSKPSSFVVHFNRKTFKQLQNPENQFFYQNQNGVRLLLPQYIFCNFHNRVRITEHYQVKPRILRKDNGAFEHGDELLLPASVTRYSSQINNFAIIDFNHPFSPGAVRSH